MELEGRVALVTGAARNIGRATALALAREGADVAITALTHVDEANAVAGEIQSLGRRSMVCTTDTSDEAAVAEMASRVANGLGKLDILVLNAAVRPGAAILEMSYEEWRRVLAINLDSAFHCTRAFLPGMLDRSWGRIITFGGAHAMQKGAAGRSHVGASKGGLLGFTRCLAAELGATGVTVNMVSPGSTDTVRDRPLRMDGEYIPVGRRGTPDEVASACVYFASPRASYVTGQVLSVNGGLVMG
ncbi:MAG TPA: SDR family oxidoreductase [Dehalococcoidia bacterium]|nr:SDR family oxidoreductase [Dehalococcoidia bacterium]